MLSTGLEIVFARDKYGVGGAYAITRYGVTIANSRRNFFILLITGQFCRIGGQLVFNVFGLGALRFAWGFVDKNVFAYRLTRRLVRGFLYRVMNGAIDNFGLTVNVLQICTGHGI